MQLKARLSQLERRTPAETTFVSPYANPDEITRLSRVARVMAEFQRRWALVPQTSENLESLISAMKLFRHNAVKQGNEAAIRICDERLPELQSMLARLKAGSEQAI